MSPRIAVVGATFGAHYARAAARADAPVELACLVGRGGATSRAVALELGVPQVSVSDVVSGRMPVDLAVVAVRSAVVGGEGDAIAHDLLGSGIAVVQELPSHSAQLARSVTQSQRNGVAFLATAFYPHLETVRRFLACCAALRDVGDIEQVYVRVSRQTLHSALFVLSAVVEGAPPRAVETMTGTNTHLVRFSWGGAEITLSVGAGLDPDEPDNLAQPLMAFTIVHPDGELTLDHPHGVTRWAPRHHTTDGVLCHPQAPAQTDLPPAGEPTGQEVLETLWPRAIFETFEQVLGGRDLTGQRELAVVRLWEIICARLPAVSRRVARIPSDRRELLARMP